MLFPGRNDTGIPIPDAYERQHRHRYPEELK